MEMMTAVNYGIPLNVVVINNGTLSLIRKNQFQLYGERYIDCDFTNPDFGLLAQSFGVNHYRIETEAELDALLLMPISPARSTSSKSCSTNRHSPAICRLANLAGENPCIAPISPGLTAALRLSRPCAEPATPAFIGRPMPA